MASRHTRGLQQPSQVSHNRAQGDRAAIYGSTSSQMSPPGLLARQVTQQTGASKPQAQASSQTPHSRSPTSAPASGQDERSIGEDLDSPSSNDSEGASNEDSGSLFGLSDSHTTTAQSIAGTDSTVSARPRWTETEDELLVASAKKRKQDWQMVAVDLAKAGGPLRKAGAVARHYHRLTECQKEITALATSTRVRHKQTSGSTSAPRPTTRPYQHWSSEENRTLAAIGNSGHKLEEVYPAWLAAYPAATRSEASVMARYDLVVRGRRGKKPSAGKGESDGRAKEGRATASRAGSNRVAVSLTAPLPRGAEMFSHQYSRNGCSTTVPESTGSHDSFGSSRQESATPLEQTSLPIAYYTITCHPSGVLVQDFPSLHHLLILAPGVCRVVGPSRVSQAGGADQLQHEQRLAAPFVFTVTTSGFVQGLTLPPATTTSISIEKSLPQFFEVSEEDDEMERPASSYVVTRFQCEDGYSVVFSTRSND